MSGMLNTYAEQLDTETTFGKESAPEGYAEQGMPNRYAEQVCRTGMPKKVPRGMPNRLNIGRPHWSHIW